MSEFYRTTFTVTVLSEGKLADSLSLEDIAWAVNEGDCVGKVSRQGAEQLTGKEMADALYEAGSEPGFLWLDDDGNEIAEEEEDDE